MWTQLDHFIAEANRDPEVKVIVLRGAGRAFCAGFDFGSDGDMAAVRSEGRAWDPGRDAIGVTNRWDAPVPNFMGLWSSPKPTIAQVHGWCVGGGSDMALSADLVIAAGGCTDRHAVFPNVGLLLDFDVDLSTGAGPRPRNTP